MKCSMYWCLWPSSSLKHFTTSRLKVLRLLTLIYWFKTMNSEIHRLYFQRPWCRGLQVTWLSTTSWVHSARLFGQRLSTYFHLQRRSDHLSKFCWSWWKSLQSSWHSGSFLFSFSCRSECLSSMNCLNSKTIDQPWLTWSTLHSVTLTRRSLLRYKLSMTVTNSARKELLIFSCR